MARGQPFKQVVNSALRIGLEQLLKPAPAKPYKTKARPLGLNEGFSYANVAETADRRSASPIQKRGKRSSRGHIVRRMVVACPEA